METKMKTIKNPSADKIAIWFIPVPIICTIKAFFGYNAPWLSIVCGIFIAIYTGLMTYFCIKQKCYGQLARIYLIIVVLVIILFI